MRFLFPCSRIYLGTRKRESVSEGVAALPAAYAGYPTLLDQLAKRLPGKLGFDLDGIVKISLYSPNRFGGEGLATSRRASFSISTRGIKIREPSPPSRADPAAWRAATLPRGPSTGVLGPASMFAATFSDDALDFTRGDQNALAHSNCANLSCLYKPPRRKG